MKYLKYCILILLLGSAIPQFAQQNENKRIQSISALLDSLSQTIPGLNERSDLEFNETPLHDFVRAVGKAHNVNVYIDNTQNTLVTNSFVEEPVKNIFLFVCRKFSYSIQPTGSILYFNPYSPPQTPEPPKQPKELNISYTNDLLSLDLKNDTTQAVLREISKQTGLTIVPTTDLKEFLTGYVPPSPAEDAVQNLFLMNGYEVLKEDNKLYVNSKNQPNQPNRQQNRQNQTRQINPETEIKFENGLVSVTAANEDLDRLLRALFEKVGEDYFIYGQIQGNASIRVENYELTDLLTYLFQGTEYTYRQENDSYLMGKRSQEGLRASNIVKLQYRPSEKVIELIPAEMKKGVELKEFVELNRIIVTGDPERVKEVEAFIKEVDRPVPMVKIEMLVVDVNVNRLLSGGIRAGLGSGDSTGSVKEVLPGVNYNFDGTEVNDLLSASGIPILSNVGALKSNFYLQIQAQESRGNAKVLTRPTISTLNGQEASLTIGETQYFKLLTNTATASVGTPITQTTETFQTVQYNTVLKVKPFVSDGDMLTLEISPNFTTPGTQADPSIPASILTREFNSTVRVKNGETIILGGLSRDVKSNSSDGFPLLSRIPVIRWFFGINSRNKSKSSLLIYITPTIYYN